jgi:hypothetical protein
VRFAAFVCVSRQRCGVRIARGGLTVDAPLSQRARGSYCLRQRATVHEEGRGRHTHSRATGQGGPAAPGASVRDQAQSRQREHEGLSAVAVFVCSRLRVGDGEFVDDCFLSDSHPCTHGW